MERKEKKTKKKNQEYKNMVLEVCHFIGLSHDVNLVTLFKAHFSAAAHRI